jgi:hypothetical protein
VRACKFGRAVDASFAVGLLPTRITYISSAHLKEYSPGAAVVDHPRKPDGRVIFVPVGPPHQMENPETTQPLKAIRGELKKEC